MKPLLIFVVAAALVLGLRQGQVSAGLAERENELVSLRAVFQADALENARKGSSGETAMPAKTERTGRPKFSAARYVAKFYKILLVAVATGKELSMDDGNFIREDLLDATPDDLIRLPDDMGRALVPDFMKSTVYEHAAARLLDKDPVLASEFAVKGGIITNFLYVMKSWIARDPVAAGAWLAAKSKADPPLDEKTFRSLYCHQEPLDVASLQLAASIASGPATADLSVLMELEGSKLKSTLDDVVAVLPPDGLPAFLKRMSESGRADLVELTLKKHPDPALAREYLQSASLPPAEFMQAATTLVRGLDPASLPRGMDWYLRHTDPGARTDGLREIVTKWTTENSRSASLWLRKLPPGKDREIAEGAYASALAETKSQLLPGS